MPSAPYGSPPPAPRRSAPSSGSAFRAFGIGLARRTPAPATRTRSTARPATSRTPSSAGRPDSSPDSPARALQELPKLVPVPPLFQELRLQLDPHRHLSQLRPGSHQLPARPVLPLQPLLAPFQELPLPPLQFRRRNPNLPAYLADVLPPAAAATPPRPSAARSTASAGLSAFRGSSPNPALPYSETSCASSLRNLPTTLRHFTNQFSDPSFLAPSPSADTSAPSTGLTARGRLIQTSVASSAALGGPATKRSGRAA